MARTTPMTHKGWFTTPGRPGDRTLDMQLKGLAPLMRYALGCSVLDVGCAEGLLSMELAQRGAQSVRGVEIVPGHVTVANTLAFERELEHRCVFECADANTYTPREGYDIILLLAVLHKLRNPSEACKRLVLYAREWVVIRLPEAGPVIVDARSGNAPHDIDAVMRRAGFTLIEQERGAFNEWVGYYHLEEGNV